MHKLRWLKLSKITTVLFNLVFLLLLMVGYANAGLVDVSKTSILVKHTNVNDPVLLKQAFAQIIANNTGEAIMDILNNAEFIESDIKAGIKRSYFEKIDNKYFSQPLINQSESFYWFHVVMHENFINDLVKKAGFSLLPHNRQEIVLWAAVENMPTEATVATDLALADDEIAIPEKFDDSQQQQQLLTYADTDEVFNYWFERWAEALGMVFVTPDMDEADRIVTPDAIQNLSFQAHLQSQLKYAKNLSLLLFMKRSEQEVKFRTGLLLEDEEMRIKHFQQTGVHEGELMYAVMADVAENYANTYKVQAVDLQSHTVQIVINGIKGFDQIASIQSYIHAMSVVESPQVISASRGQLLIVANLLVTNEAFLNIVGRQNFLKYNPNASINQLVFSLDTELDG